MAESETCYAIVCKPLTELESTLKAATSTPKARVRVLRGFSDVTENMLGEGATEQAQRDKELATFLCVAN